MPQLRARPRTRLLAVLAVLVAAVLVVTAVVGRTVWQRAQRTDLQQALALVPASTLRASWTDWAAVRRAVRVQPGAAPSTAEVERLISRAYDDDLSSASSIDDSAVALQKNFGFSPANADWELFAQGKQGATMVLKMPDSFDFDALANRLRKLGFQKPKQDTGVWKGGIDLVSGIDGSISPELQYVALNAEKHLVITSDTSSYDVVAAEVAQGEGASLAGKGSLGDLAGKLGRPAAAILWARDFACSDLAMSQASDDDQAAAQAAIGKAGEVTPLTGMAMAMAPDRTLTVGQEFADADQARRNLRSRARLAVGPAIGRGQDFADIAKLTRARTDGPTVLLTMRPAQPTGFVLSSLYDGPVLFATC